MTCIVFSVSLYKIFRLVTASGWSLPIFGGGGSVSGGFYYIRVPTWEMVLPIFGGGVSVRWLLLYTCVRGKWCIEFTEAYDLIYSYRRYSKANKLPHT